MKFTSIVQPLLLVHEMPIFKDESPKIPVYEIMRFFVPTKDKDLFQHAFSVYNK